MEEKIRNHNMDILRIFAMLCIICHHCIVNDFNLQGELRNDLGILPLEHRVALLFANAFVIIGVNVFFLLSGYFLIQFTWKKLCSLIAKVYLVFGIVTGCGILMGQVQLNGETIKAVLDPLDYYWYIMTYVFLMAVSPFLNHIVNAMTKRQYGFYMIGIFFICFGYGFLMDTNLHINHGYSFLMAMVLYLAGAGIHKFKIQNIKGIPAYFALAMVNGIVIAAVYFLLNGKWAWLMYAYNSPLIVLESISLLIGFSKLQVKHTVGRYVSKLAKSTLMVYLLHSTCWLSFFRTYPVKWMVAKGFIWTGILLLPVYAVMIYLICYVIDWIYEASFGKVVKSCINKIEGCRIKIIS